MNTPKLIGFSIISGAFGGAVAGAIAGLAFGAILAITEGGLDDAVRMFSGSGFLGMLYGALIGVPVGLVCGVLLVSLGAVRLAPQVGLVFGGLVGFFIAYFFGNWSGMDVSQFIPLTILIVTPLACAFGGYSAGWALQRLVDSPDPL